MKVIVIPPKSNNIILALFLPILFICPDISSDTFYFNDLLSRQISIITSVFILSYGKKWKSFINIVKHDFYILMPKLVSSRVFVYFVIVAISVVINVFFMGDPVHCSSEPIPNLMDSESLNANREAATNTASSPVGESTSSKVRLIMAETTGEIAKQVVYNFPVEKVVGITASVAIFKYIWSSNTPGNAMHKTVYGLGAFAGTQAVFFGAEYIRKVFIEANSDSSINSDTSSSESNVGISNFFPIHSPQEYMNSIPLFYSITIFFLNWMESTSISSNRVPSNMDAIQWDSPVFFYALFNLVVYIMYTALLYFVICIAMFYTVNYFITNKKSIQSLEKVVTKFSVAKDFNRFTTYLMGKTIVILKGLLIFLFLIIMVSSTYLYICYDFSSDIANHFNSIMEVVHSFPNNGKILYKLFGTEVQYYQKFSEIMLVFFIGIYRAYYLIRPLQCIWYIKIGIGFFVTLFVRNITAIMMNIVLVGNTKTGVSFNELFNGYNISIKLVFYSLLFFFSLILIEYILFNSNKHIMIKDNHDYNQKETNNQRVIIDFHSLFYTIVYIFIKVGTFVAFFGVFEGVLFMYTHYLPANIYSLCNILLSPPFMFFPCCLYFIESNLMCYFILGISYF